MIRKNSRKSSKNALNVSRVSGQKMDTMVDSYLTGVTSSNVICVDSLKMSASRKSSVTGPSKSQDPPIGQTEQDTAFDNSVRR